MFVLPRRKVLADVRVPYLNSGCLEASLKPGAFTLMSI